MTDANRKLLRELANDPFELLQQMELVESDGDGHWQIRRAV